MSLILSGSEGLSDVDGTAATPAIRGTDTNTGIFFPAADTIAFAEGGTEVARFDSAGSLGVGTNSPANKLTVFGSDATVRTESTSEDKGLLLVKSGVQGFAVTVNGAAQRLDFSAANAWPSISQIMSLTASGNVGIGTSSPGNKLDVAGNQGFTTAAYVFSYAGGTSSQVRSGIQFDGTNQQTLFFTGTNERMRIDTSGNVGIGTSSPAGYRLRVVGPSGSPQFRAGTDSGSYLEMNGFDSNPFYCVVAGSSVTAGVFGTQTNIPTIFFTNNTERARIDANGRVLIAATSAYSDGAIGNPILQWTTLVGARGGAVSRSDSTSNSSHLAFVNPNGLVGNITSTGTTTSYGTSSDYRLKHDIAPMTGALARVAALKPVTYKWNADNSNGEGFIAHELAEVCPDAVTGEKDAVDKNGNPVYQGIDTSFLVATLTAAIQELKAELDAVKTELAALKGTA